MKVKDSMLASLMRNLYRNLLLGVPEAAYAGNRGLNYLDHNPGKSHTYHRSLV